MNSKLRQWLDSQLEAQKPQYVPLLQRCETVCTHSPTAYANVIAREVYDGWKFQTDHRQVQTMLDYLSSGRGNADMKSILLRLMVEYISNKGNYGFSNVVSSLMKDSRVSLDLKSSILAIPGTVNGGEYPIVFYDQDYSFELFHSMVKSSYAEPPLIRNLVMTTDLLYRGISTTELLRRVNIAEYLGFVWEDRRFISKMQTLIQPLFQGQLRFPIERQMFSKGKKSNFKTIFRNFHPPSVLQLSAQPKMDLASLLLGCLVPLEYISNLGFAYISSESVAEHSIAKSFPQNLRYRIFGKNELKQNGTKVFMALEIAQNLGQLLILKDEWKEFVQTSGAETGDFSGLVWLLRFVQQRSLLRTFKEFMCYIFPEVEDAPGFDLSKSLVKKGGRLQEAKVCYLAAEFEFEDSVDEEFRQAFKYFISTFPFYSLEEMEV